MASIGFGIDAFHDVCHVHMLENIAAIERAGGYLGAFTVTGAMPEGRGYLSAVRHAQAATPSRPSIVNGSIAAAIEGKFGDVRFTMRTAGNELFITRSSLAVESARPTVDTAPRPHHSTTTTL